MFSFYSKLLPVRNAANKKTPTNEGIQCWRVLLPRLTELSSKFWAFSFRFYVRQLKHYLC